MTRRVARFFYGIAARIPPHQSGALAQCAFCEWGKFFAEKKRGRYSAVARASSSLRAHARKDHPERFPAFSTAEQIFGARPVCGAAPLHDSRFSCTLEAGHLGDHQQVNPNGGCVGWRQKGGA
jgi:hypothetical protein